MGPENSRLGRLSCLHFFILPPNSFATEKQNKTSNQIKQNKIKLSSLGVEARLGSAPRADDGPGGC